MGLTARGSQSRSTEVGRVAEKLDGITLLKGIEVDILADGRLDLPDVVLARLDIVVAAVHYNFDLGRDEADGADHPRHGQSACVDHRASDRPADWRA